MPPSKEVLKASAPVDSVCRRVASLQRPELKGCVDKHQRCCGLWPWSHPDKHCSNSKNVKQKQVPR